MSYAYNTDGSLSTITTESTVYTFTYDGFGNTTSIRVGEAPSQTILVSYLYSGHNGQMICMVYGNSGSTYYEYDELDRIKKIIYNDRNSQLQSYIYTYTATGALHTVESTESGVKYQYNYDTSGKTVGLIELHATTDENGEVSYTEKVQTVYTYDEQDRLLWSDSYIRSATGDFKAVMAGYTYSAVSDNTGEAGQLDSYQALGCGLEHGILIEFIPDAMYRPYRREGYTSTGFYNDITYTYRPLSATQTTTQVETYTSEAGSGSNHSTTAFTYTYDAADNITSITDQAGLVTKYTYDDMNQLVREDNPYLNKSYTYTYDNAGNRLTKTTYAYTTGTLGTPTNTQVYTYKTDGWGDQLADVTYDAGGNPLTHGGYTLTWHGRDLATLTQGGGQTAISFTYNSDGIRTSKTVNGTKHIYYLEGSTILAEEWGAHLVIYLYDESGAPIGMQYRNTTYEDERYDTYYFEKNLQGDIIAIYTADGTKIGGYTYDAWGNCTVSVASGVTVMQRNVVYNYNPFRYRGYYYDTQTNLYYLQSRYYDPAMGRFLNADDISVITATPNALTDKNLYAYCDNNPITRRDDGGDLWLSSILIGAGIGALTNMATTVAVSLIKGEELSLGSVLISGLSGAIEGGLIGAGVSPVLASGITGGAESILTDLHESKLENVNIVEMGVNAIVNSGVSMLFSAIDGPFNNKQMESLQDASRVASQSLGQRGLNPDVKASLQADISLYKQAKTAYARDCLTDVFIVSPAATFCVEYPKFILEKTFGW